MKFKASSRLLKFLMQLKKKILCVKLDHTQALEFDIHWAAIHFNSVRNLTTYITPEHYVENL